MVAHTVLPFRKTSSCSAEYVPPGDYCMTRSRRSLRRPIIKVPLTVDAVFEHHSQGGLIDGCMPSMRDVVGLLWFRRIEIDLCQWLSLCQGLFAFIFEERAHLHKNGRKRSTGNLTVWIRRSTISIFGVSEAAKMRTCVEKDSDG
ncbi:hypothetical protein ARMSODRAFT_606982 [Armillaria solidipes]|uniref:Uncharacterized protein n=1 Tax=Armillaria solidipes TaxID=1076256 RepID=A0A2H3B8F7_9AGAR|nr:hypothetical protein ARMSODRAFT_606982 [Armillaria solidipes]